MVVRHLLLALVAVVACSRAPRPAPIAPLPRAAYAHYLAGKLALYRGQPELAADELRAAARAAPDQPMIAVELSRALVQAKREPAAREVLAHARTRWPRHPQVWLASGELLEGSAADRRDALGAYRRAIELDPVSEAAHVGLARTQLAAGDAGGAERTLRGLIKRVPDSIDGHYLLAQRLEARGERAGAAAELRAVLERDPDHLDARMDLARTLRRLGKLPEAVAQTRSAFDRAGQPLDLAEELFWLLCEADDAQGAIDLLTLLDDDRSDAEALATVAHWNRGLGRLAEARTVAERIRSLDADAGVISLAETELAAGNTRRALELAGAVAETSRRFLEARQVMVAAHLVAREPPRALELLVPLRAARPTQLDLAFAEGIARAEAGDASGARVVMDQLRGDPAAVAFLRARIADRLGDSAGAIATLERALRDHPDHVGALNLAGYLLASRKERLADAERYLARARDLRPGDPAILDSWGWLLLQRGEIKAALRALGRASRFAPREPEILYHLAAAWAADGAPRAAAQLLDRARALAPPPDLLRRIDALAASLGLR